MDAVNLLSDVDLRWNTDMARYCINQKPGTVSSAKHDKLMLFVPQLTPEVEEGRELRICTSKGSVTTAGQGQQLFCSS